MIDPVLQVWSAPRCELGAEAFAPIPGEVAATITETVGGSDDAGTLTLPAHIARAAGIAEGRVLRAMFAQRGVVEWLIVRVTDSTSGDTTSVTLGPLRQLLALRGVVRHLTGADTVIDLPPFEGTIEELLRARVLTNLADDRLEWFGLGTIEPAYAARRYTWPAQSNVRRGEVLTLIEQVTGLEVAVGALPNDTGYVADVVAARHADRAPRLLRGTVQDLTRTRDLLQTATQVQPIGDDGQALGDVDWTGGTPIGAGPWWIPLTDPDGGDAPIQEDGQCVGTFVALPDGTTLPVLASRASDSAVQVAALGTYAGGQRVVFWEASTGRPLTRLDAPQARAQRHLVTATVTVKGARRERTRNRNAALLTSAAGWTPGTAGTLIARSGFGTTLTFQADGSRAGGTSPATPFTVDGLPGGESLHRGDEIRHVGAQLALSAAAVPSNTGALTLAFTPGLPAAYSDNDPITLRRFEAATMTVPVATTPLSGLLFLANADTALIQRLVAFARVDGYGISATTGDLRLLGPGGEIFDLNIQSIHAHEDDADTLVLRYSGFGGATPAPTDTLPCTNFAVVGPHRLRVFVPTTSVGGTAVLFDIAGYGGSNLPAWLVTPGTGGQLRCTGTIVGSGTLSGQPYLDIDLANLPAACDLAGLVGYLPTSTVYVLNTVWSGTFALTWLRETRELRFNGAHSSGATTAAFKALASLARRDWQSGDTLFSVDGPCAVTGAGAWSAAGVATVPCTIPSGVTLTAGQRVWANWHGTGAHDTQMIVVATVVGPAASVQVRGSDAFRFNWDGLSTPAIACYRVPDGAVLEILGNTLHVAADVDADGGGAASVALMAANPNAIPNDAILTLTRPAMIPDGERATGYGLRLLHAAGGDPPAPNMGVPSESSFVLVPPGETVPVTATARVVVQADTLHVGSAPMVALCNATTGQVLATGTISGSTTYDARTVLELACTAELTASAWVHLRLTGGSSVDFWRWHVALEAQFYVGRDRLPLFDGARARLAWQRGQQVLRQRASSARYVVRAIDVAALLQDGAPLAPGQSVRLMSDLLGLDEVQRIVRLQWAFPSGALIEAECAAIQPRLTDVTVSV